MNLEQFGFIPVILVMATSLAILWRMRRRWVFGTLVAQYLVVFVMVLQYWPVGLALVKLIVGLVSAAILVSGLDDAVEQPEDVDRAGQVLRSLVAVFFWVIIYFSVPALQSWLKVEPSFIAVSFILVGIGLLQLGMTTQPVFVAIGLLSFLSGFEVLYAALEESVLLAGLLAVVNLGIALVGSYIAGLSPHEETP